MLISSGAPPDQVSRDARKCAARVVSAVTGAGLWQTRPEKDHSAQQRSGLRSGVDLGQVAGSGGLRCAYLTHKDVGNDDMAGAFIVHPRDTALIHPADACATAGVHRHSPGIGATFRCLVDSFWWIALRLSTLQILCLRRCRVDEARYDNVGYCAMA